MMEYLGYQITLFEDEDDWFIADVPALMGCHTQGRTEAEALENIKDIVKICIAELKS